MKDNKRITRDEFISIMTQLCVINDLIGEMDAAIKKSNCKDRNLRIGEVSPFYYGITKPVCLIKSWVLKTRMLSTGSLN